MQRPSPQKVGGGLFDTRRPRLFPCGVVRAATQPLRPRLVDQGLGIKGRYREAGSVARSRSSWFIDWRDTAVRLIVSLASGLAVMNCSKSAFRSISNRQ